MREQRLQLLMGVRGVWVSQAAERGGCRVSFVSVETPSFSGGWLGPQCCAQPTEPGEGQETCFVHQRPDLICTGSRELCLPHPIGLRIPRHLCRCLDCHHSDFPPPLHSPHVTVLPISLLQYLILFPGALQNPTHHSCPSFSMESFLNYFFLVWIPNGPRNTLKCFKHAR